MNNAMAVEQASAFTSTLMPAPAKPVPDDMKSAGRTRVPPTGRSKPDDTCPNGLPNTLDLTELANHLLKIPEARRLAIKGREMKATKRMTPQNRLKYLRCFPAVTSELVKLSSKQLRVVMVVADGRAREMVVQKCFETNRHEDGVEIWLVNRWLKARVDKTVSMMDVSIREDGLSATGLTHAEQPATLAGEEAIIGGLASKLIGSGLDFLIRGMIHRGWIASMYQDIYDDNEFADKAASAVFAIASLVDCRWPLDLVHEHSPALYEKHFDRLVHTREQTMEEALRMQEEPFIPLPFKLKSVAQEAVFNVLATKPMMNFVADNLRALTASLNPVTGDRADHDLDKLVSASATMTNTMTIFESAITVFRGNALKMASASLKGKLIELVEQIEQMHAQFRGTFSEYDRDDNQSLALTVKARQSADEFMESEEGVAPGREASFMDAVVTTLGDVARDKECLSELASRGQKIRDEVTGLAGADPIGNRTKISACYDALEAMTDELEEANDRLELYAGWTCNLIVEEVEAWNDIKDADNRKREVQQSQHQSEVDVSELLEETAIENQELASRNLELKARVESLESGLAVQRNSQADEGMSEEVREAMQAVLVGDNNLTPAQCLLLVKATYPRTEILPTAWSSAHDAAIFEQTDRLWETLSTLAGKYTDAIVNGTPDTEARKLFTAYEYAANESETTTGGHLRKHREFRYQDETVYFEQHIKIGVAQDARKTIRVHFKIIDGVLVIAYCGGHRKL